MESLLEETRAVLESESERDVAHRLKSVIMLGVRFHIENQAATGVVFSESRNLEGAFHEELRERTREYEQIFLSLITEGIESG
jgi:hypothetical protein